jgi:tripartite-type tricarboxylate transporter receptor subunit TctC
VPGYDFPGWYGVVALAGTPRPIIQRLHTEFTKAMRAPDIAERHTTLEVEPVDSAPEQFGACIRSETAGWGEIIKRSAAKVD